MYKLKDVKTYRWCKYILRPKTLWPVCFWNEWIHNYWWLGESPKRFNLPTRWNFSKFLALFWLVEGTLPIGWKWLILCNIFVWHKQHWWVAGALTSANRSYTTRTVNTVNIGTGGDGGDAVNVSAKRWMDTVNTLNAVNAKKVIYPNAVNAVNVGTGWWGHCEWMLWTVWMLVRKGQWMLWILWMLVQKGHLPPGCECSEFWYMVVLWMDALNAVNFGTWWWGRCEWMLWTFWTLWILVYGGALLTLVSAK